MWFLGKRLGLEMKIENLYGLKVNFWVLTRCFGRRGFLVFGVRDIKVEEFG